MTVHMAVKAVVVATIEIEVSSASVELTIEQVREHALKEAKQSIDYIFERHRSETGVDVRLAPAALRIRRIVTEEVP